MMVQKMRGYRDLCSKLCNEIYECKALICGHKLTRGAKVGHFTRLNITFCFRSDGSQVKRLGVIATEFRERACIVEIGYKGRQIYVVHILPSSRSVPRKCWYSDRQKCAFLQVSYPSTALLLSMHTPIAVSPQALILYSLALNKLKMPFSCMI